MGNRLAVAIVAGSLVAVRLANAAPPTEGDLKELQGKWRLVSIVHEGKKVELPESEEKATWTVEGDRLLYASGVYTELRLDPSKTPKVIEGRTVRKGEEDQPLKGIYSLSGDELKFCICVGPDPKQVPTAFESKAGSGTRLVILKRVSPAKKSN
jgi:uncharacterized protein (TIGR03067 family)